MANFTEKLNDPLLMRTTGIVAILGTIALIVGNIVGSIVVPGHDWVADTVSDLAAGRYEIIQDVSLYGFAAALLALSHAAAHLHLGGKAWNGVILGLVLLALCVVVIAARNEYGDGDNEGIVVHIYVVYALGALFAAVFVMAGFSGARLGLTTMSRICAILWCLGAPVFFVLPTEWDGAYERGLGAITATWVAFFGWQLVRLSRQVD